MVNYYNLANTSLNHVQQLIQKETNLSKEEISKLNDSIKVLQKSLKEKTKKTTVRINKSIYAQVEKLCQLTKESPEQYIETAIKEKLEKFSESALIKETITDYDAWIDERAKELIEKYKGKEKEKKLVKTEEYHLKKGAKFVGHSIADGSPIYESTELPGKEVVKGEVSTKIPSSETRKITVDGGPVL